MGIELTDEQQDFVEAVRDFCRRECGTREQRDALTDGGQHPHNQELYEQGRRARLARRRDPGGVRRRRRRHGRPVPVPRGDRARHGADRRLRREHDRRRRVRALRHRGAEAGDPRRHRRRRASRRSRCASRAPAPTSARCSCKARAPATAATSSTARRRGSPRRTSPTTSCSSAAPTPAAPSTRA